MTPYQGIDPLPAPPVLPGKGQWSVGDAADDGDDRDAATAMVLAEAAIDRTNWGRHRWVNGLETTATPYPAQINWGGIHTFNSNVFMQSNVQISGGGVANFLCTRLSTFTANVIMQENLTVGGATTLQQAVTIGGIATHEDIAIFEERIIHTGDDAFRALRKKNGPAGSGNVQLWTADLWMVGSLSGNEIWTLPAPPGNLIVEATIIKPASTHVLGLQNDGAALPFTHLGSGYSRCIRLIFNGSEYEVTSELPY